MEEINLNISEELLENLTVEQITDLKIEVEELLLKIENLLNNCNETLKS